MYINELPFIMFKCLLWTILIECTLAFLLKIKEKKDYINIILANTITNPIVVTLPIFIYYFYFNYFYYRFTFYLLEIITVILEGFIYDKYLKYKKINPYALSLILNVSSYIIGEVINHL